MTYRVVKVRSGWRVYWSDGWQGPSFDTKREARTWAEYQLTVAVTKETP